MTADLFGSPAIDGFEYRADLLTTDRERELLSLLPSLPFAAFEFHGFEGKRRVVSYGWKYDFSAQRLVAVEPIPPIFVAVRNAAGAALGVTPDRLQQLLVTEYGPGAAIGWHKDKAAFGQVIGVSLGAPCTMRLRQRRGSGWLRHNIELEPRSAYLLSGEVRSNWEHSIPPVAATRYSLTFRTLAGPQ
ncbi:alpha-ketoglutarate-dependent dioxygenase AlkB [Devosia sp. A16]|uniref:alpha-ketoglutarate-dependent dioxygenase AlkB n=1 Tax=Devosia sp. A16 TaxID=1736675 RepID=UPI0006D7B3FB|nr:alpha-ketoglutarate-dependent dioxygenase AlkB [Devosia sp. A16]